MTELELLKVFPEAKDTIIDKIKEWTAIKEEISLKEVKPTLQKIDSFKDSFSRWFWRQAYEQCLLPEEYKQACKHIERLKRLELLAGNKQYRQKTENFSHLKEIAKNTPILSLYKFKKIRRSGMRCYACCPFHAEDTASFVIYPDNTFHCFGCQVHGDAIDFVRLLKGCDFKTAVQQLTRS